MNTHTHDWTGKPLTSALVNTAKIQMKKPMWAICSSAFWNILLSESFAIRQYKPARSLEESLVEVSPAKDGETYRDGDLVWIHTPNIIPDMLIMGNATDTHIFVGISVA